MHAFISAFFCRLGLSFNSISAVDNGTLANTPHLRELHLDNNKLIKVPGGLAEHKYIQVRPHHEIYEEYLGSECPYRDVRRQEGKLYLQIFFAERCF